MIDRPGRRGIHLVRGTLVLVTGIVVARLNCRPDPRRSNRRNLAENRLVVGVSRLAQSRIVVGMGRLAESLARRSVSRAVRSSTDINRALGDLPDRE